LHLPPELQAVVGLAGRLYSFVNQQPEFRKTGIDGASFRTMLFANLTPEIAQLLDPAQAAKIRREQEMRLNPTSAEGAKLGLQFINGVWVARGDGGGGIGNNSGKYAAMKDIGVASGVSASTIENYTRQYSGMGFGQESINTFAAIHLQAR